MAILHRIVKYPHSIILPAAIAISALTLMDFIIIFFYRIKHHQLLSRRVIGAPRGPTFTAAITQVPIGNSS